MKIFNELQAYCDSRYIDKNVFQLNRQSNIIHKVLENSKTEHNFQNPKNISIENYIKDESNYIKTNLTGSFLGFLNSISGKIAIRLIDIEQILKQKQKF